MADYFATEDDYARMVQAVGPKLAKQYMEADQKRGGMNIVPAEVEFKPIAGGLGVGGSDVNENDMLGTGALDTVAGNTNADDDLYLGALPAETTNSLRAKMSRYADLGQQQRDFYARVEEQLRAQRMGPSFSERMFELSAALAKPTTVRGFSGVLNNVMPVLQQQAKEQRSAEVQRRDALNALTAQQLAGERDLLKQELATGVALAGIDARAGKLPAVVSGPNGPLEPLTGQPVKTPTPEAYTALEANPTEENLNSFIETFPRFRKELIAAYQRGLAKKGTVK